MDEQSLGRLLEELQDGSRRVEDVLEELRHLPYTDLGFARVDHHRELRQSVPEAVYGPGKTPAQCAAIVTELLERGSGPVLLTRATDEQAEEALAANPGGVTTETAAMPRGLLVSWRRAARRDERVLVVTAGTADLPVAAECHATLVAYGFDPELLADCGVAGIHRLLEHEESLAKADAVVVVAGMEGALASVVGGITPAPVIAVPSSVGYGSSLSGITALLAMHASCAGGITVVGIDNGFGAACALARIFSR